LADHWCSSKNRGGDVHPVQQGKIRAIGVSNFSVAQIEQFHQPVAPLHVLQPPYTIERAIEADCSLTAQDNIATLGYGGVCRASCPTDAVDTAFEGDDLRRTDPKFRAPSLCNISPAVQRLNQLARERFGKRVIELAGAGCSIRHLDSVWGARYPDHCSGDEGTGWGSMPSQG